MNAWSAFSGRHGRLAIMLLVGMLGFAGVVHGETITSWSSSRVFPASRVAPDGYPRFYAVFLAGWQNVVARDDGWVDLAASGGAAAGDSLCVLARTFTQVAAERVVRLDLEVVGTARLFLNGARLEPVQGEGGYDLTLRAGRNELFLKVYSGPSGWRYRATVAEPWPAPQQALATCRPLWETPAEFLTPESVLHDPLRDVLYVTSFDNQYEQQSTPTGYVSRLAMDGAVLAARWAEGLHAPSGMAISGDRLWIAEREGLTAIDLVSGVVAQRIPIADTVFLNDVAADARGRIYVSDTRPNAPQTAVSVWRLADGVVTPWLVDAAVGRANGLLVIGDELYVGSTQDGCLKAVNLETREVRTVVSLGAGVVDGIRNDGEGGVLVSLWEGQLFRLAATGGLTQILDLMPAQRNTADFEYLPALRRLLVPTFLGNTVAAYEVAR
jgi:sugar lactone lactonase YvrE